MSWGSRPEKFVCNDCGREFEFEFDTLSIASRGGLPIKCPTCKSENVGKMNDSEEALLLVKNIIDKKSKGETL